MKKYIKRLAKLAAIVIFLAAAGFLLMVYNVRHLPTVKANYIPEEIVLYYADYEAEEDTRVQYFYTEEEYKNYMEIYDKEKAKGFYPVKGKYSPETIEKFCDIINGLELAELEWNGITRRLAYAKGKEKAFYTVHVKTEPSSTVYLGTKFGETGHDHSDQVTVNGRYVYTFFPWDGKDKLYYIKNYDKNDPPAEQIKKLIK